jgi:DNA-binding transcriptional MerR regulator
MTKDFTEVQLLPTGVYRVIYKRMTPALLKAMRTRTKGKVTKLRSKRDYHVDLARELGLELEDLKRQLEEYNKPEVDAYIEKWESQKIDADERAEQYLREFLGDQRYANFKRSGWIAFEDKNGDQWRVHTNGETYKWVDGSLKQVCIIKKSGLPDADHLISVITSIRNRPESYQNIIS